MITAKIEDTKKVNCGLNEVMLVELSPEESAYIAGGFKVRNDSGGTRRFYNLGASVPAQIQTLQPNAEGTYDGEYVIYNKSGTGFDPSLIKVDPSKTAVFRQEGNGIILDTNAPITIYSGQL